MIRKKTGEKMAIELEQVLPKDIERRSFEIITEELGDTQLIPGTEPIVKRCIHTSADFDYAKNLVFSKDAVQKALDAIRQGASIVTDTQMGKSGINKKRLAKYGGEVFCFMSDEDVAIQAKANGTTRAVASMEKAAKLLRESTDPISKIAMEVGYSNFSYFSKTFRDYVGSTPNEYRAKYRK